MIGFILLEARSRPKKKKKTWLSVLCLKNETESVSCSVVSDSLRPYRLEPARLLCLWDSPGKNTGVSCHSLLQGIFLTQGSNLGFPHYRQILYHLTALYMVATFWRGSIFRILSFRLYVKSSRGACYLKSFCHLTCLTWRFLLEYI